MVDPTTTTWTAEEEEAAMPVLAKIAHCMRNKAGLPGRIFEAHVAGKKNVSTEVVVINPEGQIYLVQRPTREKKPSEPYPEKWHSPGVTHMYENNVTPFERLVANELGPVTIVERIPVSDEDAHDLPRGPYTLQIEIAVIRGEPKSEARGKFFRVDEIPWTELVDSHRTTILPKAIAKARDLGLLK